jgi:hypothetical protein
VSEAFSTGAPGGELRRRPPRDKPGAESGRQCIEQPSTYVNGTAVRFLTRTFPGSDGALLGPALRPIWRLPERVPFLRRTAGRQRIAFGRGAGQRTRLIFGRIKRFVRGIGYGINGRIGLHDEAPVDGNNSRHHPRNRYSRIGRFSR